MKPSPSRPSCIHANNYANYFERVTRGRWSNDNAILLASLCRQVLIVFQLIQLLTVQCLCDDRPTICSVSESHISLTFTWSENILSSLFVCCLNEFEKQHGHIYLCMIYCIIAKTDCVFLTMDFKGYSYLHKCSSTNLPSLRDAWRITTPTSSLQFDSYF